MSQIITKGLLSAKLIIKGFFGKIVSATITETLYFTGSKTTGLSFTGDKTTGLSFTGSVK